MLYITQYRENVGPFCTWWWVCGFNKRRGIPRLAEELFAYCEWPRSTMSGIFREAITNDVLLSRVQVLGEYPPCCGASTKNTPITKSRPASHSAGQVLGYGTESSRQRQTLVFAPHHSFWYSQPDYIKILAFCSDDRSLAFIVGLTGVYIRPHEESRKGLQLSGSCQHTVHFTRKGGGRYTESIYYWATI